MAEAFEMQCRIAKVDESLGLVFGWALTSHVHGEEYFDTQGDAAQDEATVSAALDFAKSAQVSTDMHARDQNDQPVPDGHVPFLMPMTDDIAKAFDIDTKGTFGLMIAMRPSPDVFAKYRSGEYTGFSIGGRRVAEEVVER